VGNSTYYQFQTPAAVRASFDSVKWHVPSFPCVDGLRHLGVACDRYLGLIVPIALSIVVGTITSVQMATQNGDAFSVFWSLLADGTGTVIAALCGSFIQMTAYPNHTGFKELGGRCGFSPLHGLVFLIASLCGLLAPFLAIFSICTPAAQPTTHDRSTPARLMTAVADLASSRMSAAAC
jgi:AGZA family xanthine/uracil permease-like MFS transporter